MKKAFSGGLLCTVHTADGQKLVFIYSRVVVEMIYCCFNKGACGPSGSRETGRSWRKGKALGYGYGLIYLQFELNLKIPLPPRIQTHKTPSTVGRPRLI